MRSGLQAMRLLLLLLLQLILLQAPEAAMAQNSKAESQAEAAVQLDFADVSGKELTDWAEAMQPDIEALERQSNIAEIEDQELSEVSIAVAVASKVFDSATEATSQLGVKGAILSSIVRFSKSLTFSMLNSAAPHSPRTRMEQLSLQIERMQLQMDSLMDHLKKFTLGGFGENYDKMQQKIKNAMVKFRETLRSINSSRSQADIDRHANVFVEYYNANGIEDAAMSLYHFALSGTAENELNLFQQIAKQHSCSSLHLSAVMLKIANDFADAAALKSVVQLLQSGQSSAESVMDRAFRELSEIRSSFMLTHWECMKNVKQWAKASAIKALRSSAGKENSLRSKMLYLHLQKNFHKFSWAVVPIVTINEAASNFSNENFIRIMDPAGSSQEFLIVFGDASDSLTCGTVRHARSSFRFTCQQPKCSIAAAQGIASSSSCYVKALPNSKSTDNWLAAMLTEPLQCNPKSCSGHGFCRNHPLLHRPYCICNAQWIGDTCSERSLQGMPRQTIRYIAQMRALVGKKTKARSSVDVYYKLINMEAFIERLIQTNSACERMHRILNRPVMLQANYIAEQFNELMLKQLTMNSFISFVKGMIGNTVTYHYWMHKLRDVMLSTSCISGHSSESCRKQGLLELYKRCIAEKVVCSERHTDSVDLMKSGILNLLERVSAALMTYFSKIELKDSDDYAVTFLTRNFKTITKRLEKQWSSDSCPALQQPLFEGLLNTSSYNCSNISSFKGEILQVRCQPEWEPVDKQIECKQIGHRLQWTQQPRCRSPWRMWSSWSACSVTCGTGQRNRTRSRSVRGMDDVFEHQTEQCKMIDCCVRRYGSNVFKCRHNPTECVPRVNVCDGKRDCNDGSDEIGCNFLRNGDKISLESLRFRGYSLNCYCTSRCLGSHHCAIRHCASNGQSRCNDGHTHFHIYAVGKSIGEVLRSGDEVGFMYDWSRTNWLSCVNEREGCTARNCPGGDVNLLKSHCGGELFILHTVGCDIDNSNRNCNRYPIRIGGKVAFSRFHGRWLAAPGMNRLADIYKCMREQPYHRWYGCKHEIWRIFN